MKFNCDRCKTRYSISDERVRGKVLKIRCKNCSAVITVREGMSAAAPRIPTETSRPSPARSVDVSARPRSESALRGAFDDAMKAPSASDSMTGAPAALRTEWYMAIDGNQSGPFDLAAAKTWVRQHSKGADLYCWSEGFDDWLPIDKVSQFRSVENGAATAGHVAPSPRTPPMPTFDAHVEKTPAPLFAAAMKKVTAEAPTLLEEDDPFSASYKRPAPGKGGIDAQADSARAAGDAGGAFEFDIGEASRVVNLASLVPPGGLAGPLAQSSGLPGMVGVAAPVAPLPTISGATSPELELPRREVLVPMVERRSRVLLPLLIASSALMVVLGVLLFLAFRNSGDDEEITRGGGGGREDLARQFETQEGRSKGTSPDETVKTPEKEPTKSTGGTRVIARDTKNSGDGDTGGSAGYTPNDGEVDLGGGQADDVRKGSLQPSDIVAVYRRAQFSVNRCFENALKKNPLLKAPRADVQLRVSTSGTVESVSIPSLSGEFLGDCLRTSIGRWRFPKSTEGFSGSFPIVFK